MSGQACRSHSAPETRSTVGTCWGRCNWNTGPDKLCEEERRHWFHCSYRHDVHASVRKGYRCLVSSGQTWSHKRDLFTNVRWSTSQLQIINVNHDYDVEFPKYYCVKHAEWCAKLLLMSQGRININVVKLPSSRITNELQPNYILSIKLLEGRLESYICMFCLLSTDQAFK